MKEEEVLLEYEYYRGQIETLKQSLESISSSILDLAVVKESLDSIKALKKKNEILVPIGAGSFVNARIIDTDKVIIGLGADVAVKKKIQDAKADIEGRMKKLEEVQNQNIEKLQLITQKIQELAPQVERIISSKKEEG